MKKQWNTPNIDNLSTKATQYGSLVSGIPDGIYTDNEQQNFPSYDPSES